MTMSIEEFRASRAGRGPYPKAARAWACEYAQRQVSAGRSTASIAAELGTDPMTLRSWLYVSRAPEATKSKLRRVAVSEVSAPSTAKQFTVTTAQGHTVSGLDLESTAALLKALR